MQRVVLLIAFVSWCALALVSGCAQGSGAADAPAPTSDAAGAAETDAGQGPPSTANTSCEPGGCDDGNPCTVDRCDTDSGACQWEAVACDDGDGCNGRETCDPATGECIPAPTISCPAAPEYCADEGQAAPDPAGFEVVASDGLRLYDEQGQEQADAALDAIVDHDDVDAVTVMDVLADLDRAGARVDDVPSLESLEGAFTWDAADIEDEAWYPQGISGAVQGERRLLLASWYHRPDDDPDTDENHGARVTLADATDLDDVRYRHILLVEPTVDDEGTPDLAPVTIHAGGIAWLGDPSGGRLYVADTKKGLRVFDLSRILRLSTETTDAADAADTLGRLPDGGYGAWGYRYVLPQVTRYRLCAESCCARFSFVARDTPAQPSPAAPMDSTSATLLAGEYHVSSLHGRLHRWPLEPDGQRLLAQGGGVHAAAAYHPGVPQMQGAVTVHGDTFISTSRLKFTPPMSPATLFVGRPGEPLVEHPWPYGPEDLYYAAADDTLWSLTEHPGQRYVFQVRRAALLEEPTR